MNVRVAARGWSCLVVVAAILTTAATAGGYGTYYFPENNGTNGGVQASFTWALKLTLSPNTTYYFQATHEQDGGDPVMHLVQGKLSDYPIIELKYADDNSGNCGTSTLDACFSYSTGSTVASEYWLLVYAYSPSSGGLGGMTFTYRHKINNLQWWNSFGQPLGGYKVPTSAKPPSPPYYAQSETFQTVLVNDGPITSIFRFDYNANASPPHFQPAKYDYTSGLGGASLLPGGNNYSYFIITTAGGLPGPTRFQTS